MYNIGDRIVHPMHGAGVIDNIISEKVNGVVRDYYVLKMPYGGMLVMIPVSTSDAIGVRPIIDCDTADSIIEKISTIETEEDSNWNRRYRENMVRIKSGDLVEVARVIKSLILREREKGLSTGERKMLHTAKQILISEIVLAKQCSYENVEQSINSVLT